MCSKKLYRMHLRCVSLTPFIHCTSSLLTAKSIPSMNSENALSASTRDGYETVRKKFNPWFKKTHDKEFAFEELKLNPQLIETYICQFASYLCR